MDALSVVDNIRRTVVLHPYYELTLNRLYNQCSLAQPGTVITLVGPTRVGKTMLSHRLEEMLAGPSGAHEQLMPVVRIEAATTDRGFISTRYLTLQMLRALQHPFHADGTYVVRVRDPESDLRIKLLSSLEHRSTRFLIVDEAHHLLRTQNSRVKESVLDVMKCLGNESKCVIIFIGGYELAKHQYASAHLDGRLSSIEFSNYGMDRKGVDGFDRLLVTLDGMLPWSDGESLLKHRDIIYEGSAGCYGQLIHWSIAAIAEMSANGAKTLMLNHYRATRRIAQVEAIKEDISRGKKMMEDFGRVATTCNAESDAELAKKSRRTTKPFQRKPKRDPVGLNQGEGDA